jgi:glycosyltransferase involved in cell wall biosynthesis
MSTLPGLRNEYCEPLKKLVFISSIATPAQVKLCAALQTYFDAEFWFYEQPDRTRGAWWRVQLGNKCKILSDTVCFCNGRYLSFELLRLLSLFEPHYVILGGLTIPGNFLAYLWALSRGSKIILLTERSRDSKGKLRSFGFAWRFLRCIYRRIDLVMVTSEDIVPQFRDTFRFGSRVVVSRYAADLDSYFSHPPRTAKLGYTYLFANRLVDIYNPLAALAIFSEIHQRYPESRLLMNAFGDLRDDCNSLVNELGLATSVVFLDNISSWDQLHKIYQRSDILLLPARFSNGNFTILEAMASGMGLVISDQVLGVGMLIEDGINGFRCDPSCETFLGRIQQYISNPNLFSVHAHLNRPLVQPLSIDGTASFFAQTINSFFDGFDPSP